MTLQPSQAPARDTLVGGTWILLGDGLFIPTALVIAALLARHLGPSQFGLFVLAASIAGWLEWSLASFFSRAAIRQIAGSDDWQAAASTVLRASLAAGLAMGAGLWLLAGPLAAVLADQRLGPLLRLTALNAPLSGLALAHRFVLTGRGRFRARAWAGGVRWLGRLALVVVVVRAGFGVYGAIAAGVAATALEVLAARWFVRPSLVGVRHTPWRELREFAVPLFVSSVSARAFNGLDLLCLQALVGLAAATGLYGAAQSLATLPGFIMAAFAPVLLATLTTLTARGDAAATRVLSGQSLRMVLWLAPLAAAIAGAAGDIVVFVFGHEYAKAGPVLATLCVASLSQVLLALASTFLVAAGRPRATVALTTPLVPLALAGHLLIIPQFGAMGAATVTAVVSSLAAVGALVAIARMLNVVPAISTVARVILLSGGAYVAAAHLPGDGLLVVPRMLLVVALIAAGLVATREVTREDLRALVRQRHGL